MYESFKRTCSVKTKVDPRLQVAAP